MDIFVTVGSGVLCGANRISDLPLTCVVRKLYAGITTTTPHQCDYDAVDAAFVRRAMPRAP